MFQRIELSKQMKETGNGQRMRPAGEIPPRDALVSPHYKVYENW